MIVPIYLFTLDLVDTLERKFDYCLTPQLRGRFERLETAFLGEFSNLLPAGVPNLAIRSSAVSEKLRSYIYQKELPVIGLDRVYLPAVSDYLEITRLTDPNTGQVILSERSGKKSLSDQLSYLRSKYSGRSVILADVGAFEGKTILDVCEMLQSQTIAVEEICLGVSGSDAQKKIGDKFNLTVFDSFNFYEWIELRDLLGIDGRNVGVINGKRAIIPYWENLIKWASIPAENEEFAEEICKRYNREIIGRLWQEGYDLAAIGFPVKFLGEKR